MAVRTPIEQTDGIYYNIYVLPMVPSTSPRCNEDRSKWFSILDYL